MAPLPGSREPGVDVRVQEGVDQPREGVGCGRVVEERVRGRRREDGRFEEGQADGVGVVDRGGDVGGL